jgi:hypothetical protein
VKIWLVGRVNQVLVSPDSTPEPAVEDEEVSGANVLTLKMPLTGTALPEQRAPSLLPLERFFSQVGIEMAIRQLLAPWS